MESAGSHTELAEALAPTCTVYLPDRRGRGLSGPYSSGYCAQQDIEDMDARLTRTGAHYIFGVSSGAIIWLHAALVLPAIHKSAIFEPPLLIDIRASTPLIRRYEDEIALGKVAAALVTGMKAAPLGPKMFNPVPRWPLERLTQSMLASEDKRARAGDGDRADARADAALRLRAGERIAGRAGDVRRDPR